MGLYSSIMSDEFEYVVRATFIQYGPETVPWEFTIRSAFPPYAVTRIGLSPTELRIPYLDIEKNLKVPNFPRKKDVNYTYTLENYWPEIDDIFSSIMKPDSTLAAIDKETYFYLQQYATKKTILLKPNSATEDRILAAIFRQENRI